MRLSCLLQTVFNVKKNRNLNKASGGTGFRIGVSVTGFVGLGSVVFEFFESWKNESKITRSFTGSRFRPQFSLELEA